MNRRQGFVLLEAVVALTIVALTAATAVALAAASTRATHAARQRDAEIRAASGFLGAVVLWPRADLDRRLGEHEQGPWLLRIDRPAPTVYTIRLSEGQHGTVLLETAVFRPREGS